MVSDIKAVVQVFERRPLKESSVPDLIGNKKASFKKGRAYLKAVQWDVLVLTNNAERTVKF